MIVLTFLPRFWDKVRSGAKPNTIRLPRKRPVKSGDMLSLRRWTARPYGSPQEVLRESVCTRLHVVTIDYQMVTKGAEQITGRVSLDEFARSDGFDDWDDMLAHFTAARGLPFTGVMIGWPA